MTLLEQLLHPPFKHLTKDQASGLTGLGYNPYTWETFLASGKVTKDDLQKRLDIITQLSKLDQELLDRIKPKHPKFKKGDIIETTKYGKLMVSDTFDWGIAAFSSKICNIIKLDWNTVSKIILEQK